MAILSKLRIFDVCRQGSRVLGPGSRYVIWVQGCLRHCPGCITPESRPIDGGVEIAVTDLAADIILNTSIDGITISGGEPMLQAEALAQMLQIVHSVRPKLSVIVYTGETYEKLCTKPQVQTLLEYVDVLIDGEYIEALNDGIGMRGSSNQRIIPITHRLDSHLGFMTTGKRRIERVANDANTYTAIGVPPLNRRK